MAQKDSPVNYKLEFRDIVSLEKIFLHHKEKTKIINIIQKGYRCHLYTTTTRIDIDRKVGCVRGELGINTTPLPSE